MSEGEGRVTEAPGGRGFVQGITAVLRLNHVLLRLTLDEGEPADSTPSETSLRELLDLRHGQ
jgi:hypothetical protein